MLGESVDARKTGLGEHAVLAVHEKEKGPAESRGALVQHLHEGRRRLVTHAVNRLFFQLFESLLATATGMAMAAATMPAVMYGCARTQFIHPPPPYPPH